MFTVVITEKGGAQRRVDCDESEVTIGRVQGNDVVLPKGNVSKRHSRIVLRDDRFIVVDLKSTNGTYVNGCKITSPRVVREGDKIYIGDFILALEARAGTEPTPNDAPRADARPLPPVLDAPDMDEDGSQTSLQPSSAPPALPSHPPSMSAPARDGAGLPRISGAAPAPPKRPSPPPGKQRSMEDSPAMPDASSGPLDAASRGAPLGHPRPASMSESLDSNYTSLTRDGIDSQAARLRDLERVLGPVGEPVNLDSSLQSGSIVGTLQSQLDLGPLAELLADPDMQRIEIARFDRIGIDRGRGFANIEKLAFDSAPAFDALLRRLAASNGVRISRTTRASFELQDGTHVAVLWPPLTSAGPAAVLSRRPQTVRSLAELQNAGMLDGTQAQTLRSALASRDNVLVVGPRRANIAAIANALLAQLGSHAEVLAIEHAAELGPRNRVRVGLRWPEEGLRSLLTDASGFSVDRWMLHGAPVREAVALLEQLTARSDGSVCTLYAPSVRDALDDIRAYAKELGERTEALIAAAFPVVVEVQCTAMDTHVASVARLRMQGGRASAA